MLEDFRKIWEASTRTQGETRLNEWTRNLSSEVEEFFGETRDTALTWREEILAFFDFAGLDESSDSDNGALYPKGNRSNAVTESINRKIRDMFRSGNGYSFQTLRRKALLRYGSPIPEE